MMGLTNEQAVYLDFSLSKQSVFCYFSDISKDKRKSIRNKMNTYIVFASYQFGAGFYFFQRNELSRLFTKVVAEVSQRFIDNNVGQMVQAYYIWSKENAESAEFVDYWPSMPLECYEDELLPIAAKHASFICCVMPPEEYASCPLAQLAEKNGVECRNLW